VQKFHNTKDGRGALLTLKCKAKGPVALAPRCAKLHSILKNAKYTGRGQMSIYKYNDIHINTNNSLECTSETITLEHVGMQDCVSAKGF